MNKDDNVDEQGYIKEAQIRKKQIVRDHLKVLKHTELVCYFSLLSTLLQ